MRIGTAVSGWLLAALLPAMPAHATPIYYDAPLTGSSESPPNASAGSGIALVVIDPTAHTLSVDVTFSGLSSGTTASHIHVIDGPGDANTADTVGPVATQVPTFAGFPLTVTAGAYSHVFDTTLASTYNPTFLTESGGTPATAESALFSGIQQNRAYLNIHTTQFPGGEIRGFLLQCVPGNTNPAIRSCPNSSAVPEPGTLALVGLGVAGLLAARRRLHESTSLQRSTRSGSSGGTASAAPVVTQRILA